MLFINLRRQQLVKSHFVRFLMITLNCTTLANKLTAYYTAEGHGLMVGKTLSAFLNSEGIQKSDLRGLMAFFKNYIEFNYELIFFFKLVIFDCQRYTRVYDIELVFINIDQTESCRLESRLRSMDAQIQSGLVDRAIAYST